MIKQEREIYDLLRQINMRMSEEIQALFSPLKITMPQAMILATIHRQKRIRMTDLANQLKTSCANCSTICQRMEKAGLIYRQKDEADQRVIQLKLSEKAEKIVEEVIFKMTLIEDTFLEDAKEEEKEKMLQGLTLLSHYIEKKGEKQNEAGY